jgi:ABC-type multidrug transport system ATPase subunit
MLARITADKITKRYGSVTAVSDLSIEVRKGECVGIFGRSGSGKSTLLRLLGGTETPDSGHIKVDGKRTIALFSHFDIEADLKVAEFVGLCAEAIGIPPENQRASVRDVLAIVGLDGEWNSRIGDLPSGDKRLVRIAAALIPPSEVLLLDEPMAGLDYSSRRRLWEELLALRAREGRAIVIATSRPEDAEICDRVLLIHEGRSLAIGGVEELRGMAGGETLVLKPLSTGRPKWLDSGAISGIEAREENGALTVKLKSSSRSIDLLRKTGGEISAVRFLPKRLDLVLDDLSSRFVRDRENVEEEMR